MIRYWHSLLGWVGVGPLALFSRDEKTPQRGAPALKRLCVSSAAHRKMLFDYAKTIIQERDIYGPEQTLNTAGVGQFYFGRVDHFSTGVDSSVRSISSRMSL